ncbi:MULTISPECIES: hypothetical protein [Clostridium]|uniref:hypothetical protein n=1 Tax=Clostridium TaxID=1485 RepID=UPI000826F2BF|nr:MULTISPECIES: hypothetical protein [Clostridium]PJI10461.1 hypothetical protein CUB90_00245 [Clostridium sp. CT7]
MKKKKIIIRSFVVFIFITMLTLFFVLSDRSTVNAFNCYTVNFSDFKEISKNVYVKPNASGMDTSNILNIISKSKNNVARLYGSFNAKSIFIISKDSSALKRFGVKNKTGATEKTTFGTYIVLGPDGMNTDVISHELTHSELAYRINKINNIPVWFNEGMATQVDNRPRYSEKQWIKRTQNGLKVPSMRSLDSDKQFYASDLNTRRLNYTLAKHEVHRWLSIVGQKGLLQLIQDVNNGQDFYKAYKAIETAAKSK